MQAKKANETTSVYLLGSGIAALASAVYLIEDAGVRPENITLLEQYPITGGALDGAGDPEQGFVVRGGRMHEEKYRCYWDLLSRIPSLENPDISITAETFEFNQRFASHAQARLLKGGKKMDVSRYGIGLKDQALMLELLFLPEAALGRKRIEDWFTQDFFDTIFWYIFTTMFAFQKWSSLAEMRRYMKRFMHLVPGLNHLGGVMRTKYNQYDSVVRPIVRWLSESGVKLALDTRITDIDFNLAADRKTASLIRIERDGKEDEIVLGKDDYVFITNGSITESTDNGAWDRAPRLLGEDQAGAWQLWKCIAKKDPAFGNPGVFCDDIELQKWYSFTATLHDSTFHDYMEDFSGNVDGTGGLVTLTDSNWLMSIVIARQPHFPNQPKDVKIFWGYGLYVDRIGNHIKKKMSECTGQEILEELWYHLRVQELMRPVVEAGKVNCIPTAMPYIDSLFMPREAGDRPEVIPGGATNFAFLGQFAEVPDDCVFTVEYSVRCAQMAVYGHFDCGKKPLPVYVGAHNPKALIEATRAISK